MKKRGERGSGRERRENVTRVEAHRYASGKKRKREIFLPLAISVQIQKVTLIIFALSHVPLLPLSLFLTLEKLTFSHLKKSTFLQPGLVSSVLHILSPKSQSPSHVSHFLFFSPFPFLDFILSRRPFSPLLHPLLRRFFLAEIPTWNECLMQQVF